ncbi:hypothetical protein PoB_003484700 [Plakobranchus ocellatus]|uniref:Uncharacterized protein n=1 Tax=Plakobranchus ocellatus TaxID=259542 RepID=A0AAV4AN02_9GAST|nr:hypothetical protein PoB_003484700 [Plakobranchus ocellatus]
MTRLSRGREDLDGHHGSWELKPSTPLTSSSNTSSSSSSSSSPPSSSPMVTAATAAATTPVTTNQDTNYHCYQTDGGSAHFEGDHYRKGHNKTEITHEKCRLGSTTHDKKAQQHQKQQQQESIADSPEFYHAGSGGGSCGNLSVVNTPLLEAER